MSVIILSVILFNFVNLICHYDEFHYSQFNYTLCHFSERHYCKFLYGESLHECRCPEFHYAESKCLVSLC
jgi:hypothetical protein